MITAIDFGCYTIRSAWRDAFPDAPVRMRSAQSEYVILPDINRSRQLLNAHGIPRAECDDSIVVYGDHAERARWLSRIPPASLFNGGMVPADDPPARQILDLMTAAMLPEPHGADNLCAFTVPGSERRPESQEFLARLIHMRGFEPLPMAASDAAMLAEGRESMFTGIALVMGSETTEISLCRLGITLSSTRLPVGADWVDIELARRFKVQTWDKAGEAWLDLDAVREWKHDTDRHICNPVNEKERALAQLTSAVLDRVAQSVRKIISSSAAVQLLSDERLNVVCCGGGTQSAGFTSALTERFVDHDIAGRIQSVRTVDNPSHAVVRGLLIAAELKRVCPAAAAA